MADTLGVTVTSPGLNEVAYWLQEVEAAEERERKWREAAGKCVNLYEAQNTAANSFNILYSNTETLLPAVYNQLPRPVVRRRYLDTDAIGKAVAEVVRRGLEYTLDTPDTQYTPCDELFEAAVLGALVPGRGITRFRYDPEIMPSAGGRTPIGEPPPAGFKTGDSPAEGEPLAAAGGEGEPEEQSDVTASHAVVPPAAAEKVTYEAVCGTNVPYDRLHFGFARRWSDVPWIAYEHRMTKADLEENFGGAWADKIPLTGGEESGEKKDAADQKGAPKAAVVYEIWHKSKKRIIFVARDYKEAVIKRVDDPLGIPGFYDCPQPLQFASRNSNLVPVPLYAFYESQAKELNRVTIRLNKIVEALKVRGFYNGQIKDIEGLLTKDDNTLLAANDVASLMDSGGLEKHIWMMPLDKLVGVFQNLLAQRQQIKQVIYEITGISDIIRGSSVASETATAQDIKNKWGTLRIKRMQKEVQKYIRDCLRIIAAIQGKHFSVESWKTITELQFAMPEEKQRAQERLMQLQQQVPASMPGQPPAPPDPQIQQEMQQLQTVVSGLDWGQIDAVLKDNVERGYHVDVETNSTIDADATEDKQNITDLMTALSQAMQSFTPLVQEGALPLGVVKNILLTIMRRFQFGPEVEDALAQMPDQLPQKPDENQAKMQLEQQKGQIEVQVAQKDADIKMQLMEKELEIKQAELQLKEEELQLKREELQQRQQLNSVKFQGQMQAVQAKTAMVAATAGGGGQPSPAVAPQAPPSIDGDVVTVAGKKKRVIRDANGQPATLEPIH